MNTRTPVIFPFLLFPFLLVADEFVSYEDFGAVGDGVHDDLPAIVQAHNYANTHGLLVRTRPDATYHLGGRDLTATITTDTDWNTSRFTIDDRDVENNKQVLFEVVSRLPSTTLPIESLRRDQERLVLDLDQDYWVEVTSDRVMRFIRLGPNQNNGMPQRDCFILRQDGSIESPIDWNYDHISEVRAKPIDKTTLTIKGGVFTTIANNMVQAKGYNYWERNIRITRSNTVIIGLTHYVFGETSVGHPYRGFLSIEDCANVTLRDCFVSGHKYFETIGSAGVPVPMGTYDLNANSVVNLSLIRVRMNHILDETRWGVTGTNFCKNILLEDCELSRMDAHMGVSGTYIIRGTTLGWMGLNAIGRGLLLIEDSTIHGRSLISFRHDYGATWEGDVEIRNSRWLPPDRGERALVLFDGRNDGQHDFGYPCFMPRNIKIDGLYIDDSLRRGPLYFFQGPGSLDPSKTPFPFILTEKVEVKNLSTASGERPEISSNSYLVDSIVLID